MGVMSSFVIGTRSPATRLLINYIKEEKEKEYEHNNLINSADKGRKG